AEDGIRDLIVTGVQTCALPILQVVLERKSHSSAIWNENLQDSHMTLLHDSWPSEAPLHRRLRPSKRKLGRGRPSRRSKPRCEAAGCGTRLQELRQTFYPQCRSSRVIS